MLALALALAATTTVGSGVSKTETRTLDAFTALSAAGAFEVDVAKGDKPSCTVTADDNIVALVVTEVKDGALTIKLKEDGGLFDSVKPKTPIVVHVSAQTLASVKSSGSGALNVADVPSTKLDVKSSGSGALTWKGSADSIAAHVSGSGTATLTGKAKSLDANVSGSGGVEAFALAVSDATSSISGSGFAHVNASSTLDASISGSGRVVYAGAPKVTKHIAGSGVVEAKDKPAKAASSGW